MLCPACKATSNKVIDSRLTEGGMVIRRRRVCASCARRFTTKERVEHELRLAVIKIGGQRVPYQRENILTGITKACHKLDVDEQRLQDIADRVESDLFANHDREVQSAQIGSYVSNQLRQISPVAYVRFMSVYRKYKTIEEFIEVITEVRDRAAHDSPNQQELFD